MKCNNVVYQRLDLKSCKESDSTKLYLVLKFYVNFDGKVQNMSKTIVSYLIINLFTPPVIIIPSN